MIRQVRAYLAPRFQGLPLIEIGIGRNLRGVLIGRDGGEAARQSATAAELKYVDLAPVLRTDVRIYKEHCGIFLKKDTWYMQQGRRPQQFRQMYRSGTEINNVYVNKQQVGEGCRVVLEEGDSIQLTQGAYSQSYTWRLGPPQRGDEARTSGVHVEPPPSDAEEHVGHTSLQVCSWLDGLELIGALTRREIEVVLDRFESDVGHSPLEPIAAVMTAVGVIRATNRPPPSAQAAQLYTVLFNSAPTSSKRQGRKWHQLALVFIACALVALGRIVGRIESDRDISSAHPSLRAALPCRANPLGAVSSAQLAQLGLAAQFLGKAFCHMGRYLREIQSTIPAAPTSASLANPACTQAVWRAFLLGTYDRGSNASMLRLAQVGLMLIFSVCRLPAIRRFYLHDIFSAELLQFDGNASAKMTRAARGLIRAQLGVPIVEGLPAEHREVLRLSAALPSSKATGVWLLTSHAPAPWDRH